MTILVATDMQFANLANGRDLRVWNLCRELARLDELVHVPIACDETDRGEIRLDPREIFREAASPLRLVNGHASLKRHLRLNEAYYYPWSYPDYCRRAAELVAQMQRRHGARRIVAFGETLAGILRPFRASPVLIDICDSASLQIERYAATTTLGWRTRLQLALEQRRWRSSESVLPRWYAHVTAASEADAEAVRRASRCVNVTAVPNGVDLAMAAPHDAGRPAKRAVIFWGDLIFTPNDQAIRWFHERVYAPLLAPRGIEWCVVGRNARPWLIEAARRSSGIRIAGYVPDLRAAVADYPVVVNPMVCGSGVKNKVLEALALGKAVVSTPLGIESIAGAVDGVHYLAAATPETMAEAIIDLLDRPERRAALGANARQLIIERHSWNHVGEKLRGIVAGL